MVFLCVVVLDVFDCFGGLGFLAVFSASASLAELEGGPSDFFPTIWPAGIQWHLLPGCSVSSCEMESGSAVECA